MRARLVLARFFAPAAPVLLPVPRFAVERDVPVEPPAVAARLVPVLLRLVPPVERPAPLARLAAVPADFARLVLPLFFAPPDAERVERAAVDRDLVDFFAVERLAVERDAVLRAVLPRAAAPPPVAAPSSADQLPDITRCAASATASAINEPSLDALEATLLAACCAVSAASTPASRILRRAAGLALIAAAAAASPAASISRLIAALAILSTVLLADVDFDFDLDREEPLELFVLFLVDLAIANLPSVRDKRHFRSVTVPTMRKCAHYERV